MPKRGMQHRLTWAKVLLQKLSDQSLDVKKITFTDDPPPYSQQSRLQTVLSKFAGPL